MKVQQFIIIYFIIAALAGVVAVSRLGEDFIPVYLGAVIVGGLGAAGSAAASGVFGPKAAVVAGAVAAVAGLWTKRPKDATESDKAEPKE